MAEDTTAMATKDGWLGRRVEFMWAVSGGCWLKPNIPKGTKATVIGPMDSYGEVHIQLENGVMRFAHTRNLRVIG